MPTTQRAGGRLSVVSSSNPTQRTAVMRSNQVTVGPNASPHAEQDGYMVNEVLQKEKMLQR